MAKERDPWIRVKYATAAHLLLDENLVWSEDFDAIRKPLAALMVEAQYAIIRSPQLQEIADKLLEDEYDITV